MSPKINIYEWYLDSDISFALIDIFVSSCLLGSIFLQAASQCRSQQVYKDSALRCILELSWILVVNIFRLTKSCPNSPPERFEARTTSPAFHQNTFFLFLFPLISPDVSVCTSEPSNLPKIKVRFYWSFPSPRWWRPLDDLRCSCAWRGVWHGGRMTEPRGYYGFRADGCVIYISESSPVFLGVQFSDCWCIFRIV